MTTKGNGASFKYLAKTFTLSDVQPGSIIEYHYSADFPEYRIYDSHWTLSEELFTKRGKYSLKTLCGVRAAVELAQRTFPKGRHRQRINPVTPSPGSSEHPGFPVRRRHASRGHHEVQSGPLSTPMMAMRKIRRNSGRNGERS